MFILPKIAQKLAKIVTEIKPIKEIVMLLLHFNFALSLKNRPKVTEVKKI
jgi:hypothetical protein